ncbi:MAG: response regulator [Nitrospirae bacterium]|nr:response regulator [Nitrospirota bacterium]
MARKLLLADDSITIQKVVELVLAEEDFEIKSVSNGEDALNLLESFQPDLVLADIEMPKVNGYQLCDRIKKNPATAHIPVILLAGAFEPIDEELAAQIHADDSVIKPFESQELISKINSVLTMSSAGAEELVAAEETVAEAGEDVFVLTEEAEEAVSVAEAEEDLWSMEEVPEIPEAVSAEAVPEAEEAVEAGIEGLEETFEIEEETMIPEIEEAPAAAAPAAVIAEAARPQMAREFVMPEVVVPSKAEMLAVFEKTVNASVTAFLSSLDIKAAMLAALTPAMKESVEKVIWEIAPELAEKLLKEVLKGSIASLTSEVEKVIWETVPDLASTMISKEIEKIKSEF